MKQHKEVAFLNTKQHLIKDKAETVAKILEPQLTEETIANLKAGIVSDRLSEEDLWEFKICPGTILHEYLTKICPLAINTEILQKEINEKLKENTEHTLKFAETDMRLVHG